MRKEGGVGWFETRLPVSQVADQFQAQIETVSTASANRFQQDARTFAKIEVAGKQNLHWPVDVIVFFEVEKPFAHAQVDDADLCGGVSAIDKGLLDEVGVYHEQIRAIAIPQYKLPQVRLRVVADRQAETFEFRAQHLMDKRGMCKGLIGYHGQPVAARGSDRSGLSSSAADEHHIGVF